MRDQVAMTDALAVTLPTAIQAHADQAMRALARGMVPVTVT